jgi:hypothetical protein
MQYDLKSRIEKVASKDQSRPALASCYLRAGTAGTGTLEATDSYKFVRVPVVMDEGDVEGFIPVEAFAAARKNRAGYLNCNGSIEVPGGPTFPRQDCGQFPDSTRLFPEQPVAFTVGLNAKLLYELAQGLGTDTVQVSFVQGADGPDPLRPMIVTPANGLGIEGADGILMPIRVQS